MLICFASAIKFGLNCLKRSADIITQCGKPTGRGRFARINVGADGLKISFADGDVFIVMMCLHGFSNAAFRSPPSATDLKTGQQLFLCKGEGAVHPFLFKGF